MSRSFWTSAKSTHSQSHAAPKQLTQLMAMQTVCRVARLNGVVRDGQSNAASDSLGHQYPMMAQRNM